MLLSRKEAAGELGVSPDSITRLNKNGELKGIEFPKMGGRGKNVKRMYEKEEIERFKIYWSSVKKGGRG
ncbi:MAG TPA: hypothetical protein VGP62_13210 [Bryobacteraceae bacterium]|jgi:transposase|nr:hypothetical protein [Bryobacteraceae bacterium]